jgi:hypothetical protein
VGYSQDSNDVKTDAEESSLLKPVARKRLVMTLQAGEERVVICKVWRLSVTL